MTFLRWLFKWWKPHYYCFVLTFLISIALTVRSQHGIDSAVVWWINFLPVVCLLWNKSKEVKDNFNLNLSVVYAVIHYLVFHLYHFQILDWSKSVGVYFWPASLISFTLVSIYVFFEMRSHE